MSSIRFYSDSSCTNVTTETTGPPDGQCTLFGTYEFGSFRLISLQQTCAVTIYDSDIPFCSSTTLSTARLGICYSNATVNQFSVDCQDVSYASTAIPTLWTASSSTTTASSLSTSQNAATSLGAGSGATVTIYSTILAEASAAATSNTSAVSSSLSTGAQAGIGVGVALICIFLGLAVAFLLVRRKRRQRAVIASEKDVSLTHTSDSKASGLVTTTELSSDAKRPAELPLQKSADLVEAPEDRRTTQRCELDGNTFARPA